MTREEILDEIERLAEAYVGKLQDNELPNERSGMIDDFASFLVFYQDMGKIQ